ncbi:MAG: hypothetical protein OTJ97_05420 [SAR202 cluster bacterium]|nr:hypothetical protein [SAR202 cluster bacterium]
MSDYEVTSTQKGAIGENYVAQELILQFDGRLYPFKPIADDDGVDLLVLDKKMGNSLPLQVKMRTKTIKASPKVVHFEVRKVTFKSDFDGAVLAVLFKPEVSKLEVDTAWLIPMKKLHGVTSANSEKFVLRPSIGKESKGRYREFRCVDFSEVTKRVVELLDS